MRLADKRHLMSAQEVVASTLVGKGVTVVFDAESPWVEIHNKVMHLRPLPEHLDENDLEDVRGDCDHEIGHLKFTDPNAFSVITRRLVHVIANAIEDGRVERLMAAEWSGCGENLERSGARALAKIVAAATDETANVRSRVVCALSLIAYGSSAVAAASRLGVDTLSELDVIGEFIGRIQACSSSADAVALAVEVANRFCWRTDESPSEAAEDKAAAELVVGLLSPAMSRKQLVGQLSQVATNVPRYLPFKDKDLVEHIQVNQSVVRGASAYFFKDIDDSAPQLKHRLLMALRRPGRKMVRHQRRGEIDDRVLYRAGVEDDRLFRRELRGLSYKTVVTLLVDCSISMTETIRRPMFKEEQSVFRTRLFVAAQAAAAVSRILELLQIPNECLAFTTARMPCKPTAGFTRVRPLRHLVIKPFAKSFHTSKQSFVSLATYEMCGENVDGEALLWAARRLSQRVSSDVKPVMIVLSDGEPRSSPERPELLAAHLTSAVARVDRAGIGVVGVGVGSDAVRRFYRENVVIDDVSQLVEAGYNLIVSVVGKSSSMT